MVASTCWMVGTMRFTSHCGLLLTGPCWDQDERSAVGAAVTFCLDVVPVLCFERHGAAASVKPAERLNPAFSAPCSALTSSHFYTVVKILLSMFSGSRFILQRMCCSVCPLYLSTSLFCRRVTKHITNLFPGNQWFY